MVMAHFVPCPQQRAGSISTAKAAGWLFAISITMDGSTWLQHKTQDRQNSTAMPAPIPGFVYPPRVVRKTFRVSELRFEFVTPMAGEARRMKFGRAKGTGRRRAARL